MSEHAEELAELREQMSELAGALRELRDSSTAAEKARHRDDVDSLTNELRAAGYRITRHDLDRLVAEDEDRKFEARLAAVRDDMLQSLRAELEPEPEPEPEPDDKPKPDDKPDDKPEPKPDDPPARVHFLERSI